MAKEAKHNLKATGQVPSEYLKSPKKVFEENNHPYTQLWELWVWIDVQNVAAALSCFQEASVPWKQMSPAAACFCEHGSGCLTVFT